MLIDHPESTLDSDLLSSRITLAGSGRIVHLIGELDLSNRDRIAALCLDGTPRSVVIELSTLTFMDCAGYGSVSAVHQIVERHGGSLDLANPTGLPARLIGLLEHGSDSIASGTNARLVSPRGTRRRCSRRVLRRLQMAGIAIITEACIAVKDRACVDVCPVQCIYEYDPATNQLRSEEVAGSGTIENSHTPNPDTISIFGDSILYVNLDECTSCTACYQPDVCPVGAIYPEEHVPDGTAEEVQRRGSEHRPRPHVLHRAQPRSLRRLECPRPSRSVGDRVCTAELLWIPLGAGQHIVRVSGHVFETPASFVRHRPACDLYHSALVVTVPDGRYVIEMTPVPDRHGEQPQRRGQGAVGSIWLGKLKVFRYEIRRWRAGVIPDAELAAASTILELDLADALRLLDLVPSVHTPVWERDELDAGEMWNSNSVTSWILCRAGIDTTPPRTTRWRPSTRLGRWTRHCSPPRDSARVLIPRSIPLASWRLSRSRRSSVPASWSAARRPRRCR